MGTGPLPGCRCYSILPYVYVNIEFITMLPSGHTATQGDLSVEGLDLVLH